MTVSTAPNSTAAADPYAGDRTGTILGALAGVLGGGGVLFFWIIGAIGLLGGNGGFIQNLQLEGVWRTLFLAYPFVFLAALVAGAALASLKRDLEAVGVLGLPVVAAVLYYLALIHVRPV
jgi:predicted lipid-binding transport protein (Tim44 family)